MERAERPAIRTRHQMKIILLENAMSIQNKRMRNMLPKLVNIQVANLCVVIVTEALNQSENVLFIKTVSFLSATMSSQHRHRISESQ